MDSRYFNSIFPKYNEKWASEVLGLDLNVNKGPDLLSNNCLVEIKFASSSNIKDFYKWTFQEHQASYPEKFGLNGFLGLGFYNLKKPVSEISKKDLDDGLENLVSNRELYLINWDWINQFKMHISQGKTSKSTWNNQFRYFLFSKIPKTENVYDVFKGKVHLTENVENSYFPNLN